MGRLLDGIAEHMANFAPERTFMLADGQREPSKSDVVDVLRETRTDVMVNYLPVGSQKAAEFYAECALEARVALVNCIPVFIASDDNWSKKPASRSSATTSSRSSARPSFTGSSPTCSESAV
jgi:myo-inositol-1-phosphate synthase